jgi:Xaa-Pro aminopeptidase
MRSADDTAAAVTPVLGDRALFDDARRDRKPLFNRDRLSAAIQAADLDAVVAVTAANITYTGGAWVPHPLLLSFVITTASHEQIVVINEADEYYFNEYSWVEDIRGFRFGSQADDGAFELFREAIGELGLDQSALGIELSAMPKPTVERLEGALPGAKITDAHDVFEAARLVKTPAELDLIRLAAYCTDKAIQTAFALTAPGDTEKSLAASMQANALHLGADTTGHTHVHAGTHSNVVHTLSLERPMASGELVHVDFGAVFAGYATDISRNAVIERPSARQLEIYRRLLEIERMLIDHLRPGVKASAIFERAVAAFDACGLTHPWGTLGHSTGLTIHEGFEFAVGAETILAPGMVVCIEPSHIEQGDGRYHIEDCVIVTEGDPEVISDFAAIDDLFVIR